MSQNPETSKSTNGESIPDGWKSLIQDGIYGIDFKRTKEYENSIHGQKELAEEIALDESPEAQLIQKRLAQLEQDVRDGNISKEQAAAYRELYLEKYEKMHEAALGRIDDYRQDYIDSQVVGTPEEQAKYQAWLEQHDAENMQNLEARGASYQTTDENLEPAPAQSEQSESATEVGEIVGTFQVAPGVSKEAEFKRLTGEDWPGVTYVAETDGVDDDGYDQPIENWVIRKRVPEGANESKDGEKAPDDEQEKTPTADEYDEGIKKIDEVLNDREKVPTAEELDRGIDKLDDILSEDEEDEEGEKNGVEIGEIDITGIEQEFAEDKTERLKELEGKLEKILPDLAELYAKNRRLIVGPDNRAAFAKVKGEYGELLDEYLKLKAGETYEKGKHEIAEKLESRIEELTAEINQKLIEFVGGDPKNTEKTQEEVDAERERLIEEAEKTLRDEYSEMTKALETEVNAEFLHNFLLQEVKLEDATIDKLDNGTWCRKFVNKVINNKALKVALIAAAAAGLVVTGVGVGMGLAAGTMAAGLSFTAGGVAAGAAKGGLAGMLMSRQNSKNSAVHNFATEAEMRQQLEGINLSEQDGNTVNVAEWLMGQYGEANTEDRSSNRKRSLVSAGIGAALGAFASGIQINDVSHNFVDEQQITGYEPAKYSAANLDQVNIPEGHGMWDTFTQAGGDPSNFERAQEIAHSIDAKYGLSPGSNGVVAGYDGTVGDFAHTYPGTIDTWPDTAQQYIREVADAWAQEGLVPGYQTGGGEPIYSTTTRLVEEYVPNAFYNFLARATAVVGAGAIGGAIGGLGGKERARNITIADSNDGTADMYVDGEQVNASNATAPETPNAAPEASEEEPSTKEAFEKLIKDRFGDSLGEEGIEIMTDESPGTYPNLTDRIYSWWNGLSEEQRAEVKDFESSQDPNSKYGKALRMVLPMMSDSLNSAQ